MTLSRVKRRNESEDGCEEGGKEREIKGGRWKGRGNWLETRQKIRNQRVLQRVFVCEKKKLGEIFVSF